MSQVITCPNCDKKLALRDELKGRALICPQCKGRFTAPADGPEEPAEEFGTFSEEVPSPGGADMAFLDSLTPTPGPVAAKTTTNSSTSLWSAAGKTAVSPTAASRAAASRAKKKNDQMMLIYIGGGVAAAVLVAVLIVGTMSSGGGATKKKDEDIRFGLTGTVRHQLFKELILAVDKYGISKDCKEEWFRLADDYKLDRKYIKDVLDEGFDRKDWDQPAPAHVTNKTRGVRMEWNAKRAHGGDPILAM